MTTTTERLAHIVHPAASLQAVVDGKKSRARALCGKYVVRRSTPHEDVCRTCFEVYSKDLQAFRDAEAASST